MRCVIATLPPSPMPSSGLSVRGGNRQGAGQARLPCVSVDWVLTGIGNPLREVAPTAMKARAAKPAAHEPKMRGKDRGATSASPRCS